MVLIWDFNVDFHGKLMKIFFRIITKLSPYLEVCRMSFCWSVLTGIKYLLLTSDDMNGF